MPSIQATALDKSYTTGKIRADVVKDLSLEIRPGELTLIVGPSGCGKSTLLALLSGLARPDAGTVTVLGQDLWQKSAKDIAAFRLAHCGFIFQGFNLFSSLTALQQVELALDYTGQRNAQAAAREALDQVGLSHKSHLRPAELSGGEKQRVAIARAIAKQPQLLFADEPTSALDAANGSLVTELLHRIARERNATVVGVTHDPRLLKHADRVLEVEDGRILSDSAAAGPHTGSHTRSNLALVHA